MQLYPNDNQTPLNQPSNHPGRGPRCTHRDKSIYCKLFNTILNSVMRSWINSILDIGHIYWQDYFILADDRKFRIQNGKQQVAYQAVTVDTPPIIRKFEQSPYSPLVPLVFLYPTRHFPQQNPKPSQSPTQSTTWIQSNSLQRLKIKTGRKQHKQIQNNCD